MIRQYLLIVLLGAGAGALAKAATFAGLLDLEASTTAFLVAVIGASIKLLNDFADRLEGS